MIKRCKNVITQNYQQLFFIFAIFFFMVFVSYFSVSNIVRSQLLESAEKSFNIVESNVQSTLQAHESILTNTAFTIQNLLSSGASTKEVEDYMYGISEWIKENNLDVNGFNGIYGYIYDDFINGMNWTPTEGFVPTKREWFILANKANGQNVMSNPYIDANSGEIVVSLSRQLFDNEGNDIGVLAVDVFITNFAAYVEDIQISADGYGMLLNEDLTVIAHPDNAFIGSHLNDLTNSYTVITDLLMRDGSVTDRKLTDYDGRKSVVFFNQLYNGWYVGISVPANEYHSELYTMGLLLLVIGLVSMLSLSYLMIRVSRAKQKSDEANQSKSSFLARMSHEIRTPLNAIIGMSELAMREDNITPTLYENVSGIRQAGMNLLAIINDILDISKIESGNLQLHNIPYALPSIINDIISVIKVRLNDKPIVFTVFVDSGIPNTLIGDEVHIRQILLNLLNNAVKYTNEGYISLRVYKQFLEDNTVELAFEVSDSGIGIAEDDIENLFADFKRVDLKNTGKVEGTGLGLVITQNLCAAMNGNIKVESIYGVGSTFTATIQQSFTDSEPLARIQNEAAKRVLVYNVRKTFTASILTSFNNLGVNTVVIANEEQLHAYLLEDTYPFIFTATAYIDEILKYIKDHHLRITPIIVTEASRLSRDYKALNLNMPAYCVPIANILNNNMEMQTEKIQTGVRFIAPSAHVLIVDDVMTNLKVAEGLLAPFQMKITICNSGMEAIQNIRMMEFDFILMDHMMPEMDGIETTKRIQSMNNGKYKSVPIIALTANAVSGMREMFLENGFVDYLAKPIEINKLNAIVEKWIPQDKQIKYSSTIDSSVRNVPRTLPNITIDGMDFEKGLTRFSDNETLYLEVLQTYVSQLPALIKQLKDWSNLANYAVNVHGLKGSSYNICAEKAGKMAEILEYAAKKEEYETVVQKTPELLEYLSYLQEQLELCFESFHATERTSQIKPSKELLQSLLEACESFDVTAMEKIITELDRFTYTDTPDLVAWLRERLDNLEYDSISKKLTDLLTL